MKRTQIHFSNTPNTSDKNIMGLQNERIYKILTKSNNGKVVKYTGKIFLRGISQGGGES